MNTQALQDLTRMCCECIREWKKEKGGELPISFGDYIEHCRMYGSEDIQHLYEDVWDGAPDDDAEVQAALWRLERGLLAENVGARTPRIVIGSRITQLRKARGMTQEELAAATGIRQEHLSRIEAGRYSVGIDTLAKIAEGLGCKIDIVEG